MQKISSIHQLIFEIEQVLESHELKNHSHIKIIELAASVNLYKYAKNTY